MPALANAKHEAFAQAVVSGCSLTEAAKRAGHKVGPANFGSRLMERAEIAQRIIELQASTLPQTDDNGNQPASAGPSQNVLMYTEKPWIVAELVSIHRLARKLRDISGSNTALKTLAQIGGHLDGPGRRGPDGRDPATLALLGIKEIHGMLTQVVGKAPRQERAKLLAEAPELRELVGDVEDVEPPAEQPPAE